MSKEKRRVPKLRFPGFTEDWEQRKFSEIYERAGQKNDLTYGIDKIISVANMYFKKDVTVGSEEYLKTYNVFKLGDIAFEGHTNKEYRYGRFVENTIGDGIVSHIFDVFTPKINLDINFWKDLIKYEPIMGPILRRCTKASRMMSNLTTKEFLEEQILCPTLEEQKLIGEFIVSLDKNITLHQRKLDNLKLKKKALLQKLFPKNGERYPELRFPGFTDAWEQRKLGQFTARVTRKNGGQSDLPLTISAQDGLVDQRKYFNRQVASRDMSNYYLIKKGEFAYNKSYSEGYPFGAVKRLDYYDIGALSTLYILFEITDKNIISDFIVSYYMTHLWYKEISKRAAEGARNHGLLNISTEDFFDSELNIPNSMEEQVKIGNFIKAFDKFITLHQRKLDHLQLQKKALLQQMFV